MVKWTVPDHRLRVRAWWSCLLAALLIWGAGCSTMSRATRSNDRADAEAGAASKTAQDRALALGQAIAIDDQDGIRRLGRLRHRGDLSLSNLPVLSA